MFFISLESAVQGPAAGSLYSRHFMATRDIADRRPDSKRAVSATFATGQQEQ